MDRLDLANGVVGKAAEPSLGHTLCSRSVLWSTIKYGPSPDLDRSIPVQTYTASSHEPPLRLRVDTAVRSGGHLL